MKVLSTKHFCVSIPGKRELAPFDDGAVVSYPTVYDKANQAEVSISTVLHVFASFFTFPSFVERPRGVANVLADPSRLAQRVRFLLTLVQRETV
jgi:hypothetical protein